MDGGTWGLIGGVAGTGDEREAVPHAPPPQT